MKSKRKTQQLNEVSKMELDENGEVIIETKEEKEKPFTYDDYAKAKNKRAKRQTLIRSSHR